MNIKRFQFNMPIYILILLAINFITIFILCLAKGQLNFDKFFLYMFYAALINMVVGLMALKGNVESRQVNMGVNYNIYSKKSNDTLFEEEMANRRKGSFFTIGLEACGIIMLIIYMIFKI